MAKGITEFKAPNTDLSKKAKKELDEVLHGATSSPFDVDNYFGPALGTEKGYTKKEYMNQIHWAVTGQYREFKTKNGGKITYAIYKRDDWVYLTFYENNKSSRESYVPPHDAGIKSLDDMIDIMNPHLRSKLKLSKHKNS